MNLRLPGRKSTILPFELFNLLKDLFSLQILTLFGKAFKKRFLFLGKSTLCSIVSFSNTYKTNKLLIPFSIDNFYFIVEIKIKSKSSIEILIALVPKTES